MTLPVSLYIPCYNASRYIEQCLESVFQQSYPIEEILVVDDGSNDNTLAIIRKYPQVHIIIHEKNRGLASARNTAIQNMNSECIANLDADCIAEKDWLENLMNHMSDDKIAGVGGRLIESNRKSIPDYWRTVHMKQDWGNEFKINPDWVFGHSAVFRKSALQSVRGYQEKFKTNYEDIDISRRFYKMSYTLVYEPRAIVRHLRTDTGLSVLRTRWAWTALGVHGPVTGMEILKNMGRNFGRSIKYLYQDIRQNRISLLGLDFALGFYSTFADLRSLMCRQLPK